MTVVHAPCRLVGSLSAGNRSTTDNAYVAPTGGDAALMDDAIHVCARSDLSPSRFFDGSVAHVALWDDALNGTQVRGSRRARQKGERAGALR